MKVIDLLNKIANGEEVPKVIEYGMNIYQWTGLNYYNNKNDEYLDSHICIEDLEQCIEIIEENNKIEYVGRTYDLTTFYRDYPEGALLLRDMGDKIKEIIDKYNKEKE